MEENRSESEQGNLFSEQESQPEVKKKVTVKTRPVKVKTAETVAESPSVAPAAVEPESQTGETAD